MLFLSIIIIAIICQLKVEFYGTEQKKNITRILQWVSNFRKSSSQNAEEEK